jgi:translation initiation factor IF-2
VRYVVAGPCGLIVVLVVLLVVMRSRRERAGTAAAETGPARARPRGQHEQRRPEYGPGREATGQDRPRPAPAGPTWTAAGGWHGGSLGEMQPSQPASPALPPSPGPAAPLRPAMAPAPKAARAAGGSSGPPWEPAPEPEQTFGPLPVLASSALSPGPGIRVPGDMAALPAVAADAMLPAPFDVTASPDPDFPPRPAAGDGFPGRPGLPARQSFGLAAAPVPVDYAPPQAPDFTVPSRAGGVVLSAENGPRPAAGPAGPAGRSAPAARETAPAKADPSYIWDLAATDVFPAAADQAPPAETPAAPGAAPADDGPGAD